MLSTAHYFETQRRGDPSSRWDLATTMAKLSRFHAIAPPHVIVPAEIDSALDCAALSVQLFGIGLAHVTGLAFDFGGPIELPEGVDVPPGVRSQLTELRDATMEMMMLANPPLTGVEPQPRLETARVLADADAKFSDGQGALARQIVDHKLRGRLGDVITATELVDILEPMTAALLARGRDPLAFLDDKQQLSQFLHSLPSRWVTRELRRMRHANSQKKWEPHDLNDVNALSIAVPYCDVVVTERQWAHHLNDSGLAAQFGTTVLHRLADLTGVLISADVN